MQSNLHRMRSLYTRNPLNHLADISKKFFLPPIQHKHQYVERLRPVYNIYITYDYGDSIFKWIVFF